GPAGLAAAVYAQRAKLSTVILEKEYISGGQVVNTYEVDNYPGLPGINGYELGVKFREHADQLGAEFVTAEVEEIIIEKTTKKVVSSAGEYRAKSLILAMGAAHRELGVPGEKELAGMGVSYCATCDGAFFRGRRVAVVGGGDVAVEDAIFLARGCEKVFLIHRRDELRAAKSLQERLFACENVEIIWDTAVREINGEDHVESIRLENLKTGEKRSLDMDGVFVAVGVIPNSRIIKELVGVDENGYILAGEDCASSVKGIFAAGDIRKKPLRQIVTAVADGANAVTAVQEYLLSVQ
ncbi:MAG: thioredoxin-disulfide reductase, partial [Lachnospiraceae bacterium]|nr:thioredoxin-disulfide reductase [Lachnospiraceae bacterium]